MKKVEQVDYIPEHPDFEDYTVPELRGRIGKEVGAKQTPRAELTLRTLNKVHAYLTGETAVKFKDVNTERSPGIEKIRVKVATQVQNTLVDDPDPDDEDNDYSEWPMSSYIPGPGGWQPEPGGRPFRKEELQNIARAVDRTKDQRDWVQPDG